MKLKEQINPKHVYEGTFESNFIRPFVHHYADFSGTENPGALWRALVAWGVITLGVVGVLMGLVGLLGPEVGFSALWIIGILWGAASLCPLAALIVRSSHTNPDAAPVKPLRLLGIDCLLGFSCIAFFLLGLLMMITTMNSGTLNPNANMVAQPDTTAMELEQVQEEPIFTYQDEAAEAEQSTDSLRDMDEPDLVPADQSFDPTLRTADEADILATDSI
ncbi:MAG: hypothetical protein K2M87_08165 [Muribaculaceae bacterium]|nr:hypothetical protein [Muribaculaceae bacterium]